MSRSGLLKISGMSIFNLGVKLITGLVITKTIARYYGPDGMAYYGQYINLVALLGTISIVGLHVGVVKRFSHSSSFHEQKVIISTVITVIMTVMTIVAMYFLIFSDFISYNLFGRHDFGDVVVVSIFAILCYGLQLLSQAVLTGLGQHRKLLLAMLLQTVVPLLTILLLIPFNGERYLLYGAILGGILSSLYTFAQIARQFGLSPKAIRDHTSIQTLKSLTPFIVMILVSTASQHGVFVLTRTFLIDEISTHHAGLWNGMLRVSDIALTTTAMIFGIYYLPKVSAYSQSLALRREMFQMGRAIIPLAFLFLAAAYLSRDLIIKTVFSQSFNEMIHLFLFQLLGDFFRIISWIFSYILLAKIKIKYFVISELVFAIFFYFSTRILLKEYGFSTISLTYLLSTVFYLGVVLLFVYKGVLSTHEEDERIA